MDSIPEFEPETRSRVTVRQIDRAPVPHLRPALAKTPFQAKPHVSTWFLTLNTNQGSKDELSNQRQVGILRYVLQCMFEDTHHLLKFMNIRQNLPTHPELAGHVLTPRDLEDKELFPDLPGQPGSGMKLSWVPEVGTKRRRVHIHAKFSVIHYTWLDIDKKKLSEMASECLRDLASKRAGVPSGIYVNTRFVRNDKFMVGNYAAKTRGAGTSGWSDVTEALERLSLDEAKVLKGELKPTIPANSFTKKQLKRN